MRFLMCVFTDHYDSHNITLCIKLPDRVEERHFVQSQNVVSAYFT